MIDFVIMPIVITAAVIAWLAGLSWAEMAGWRWAYSLITLAPAAAVMAIIVVRDLRASGGRR